jgi:dihydrofolate reductase
MGEAAGLLPVFLPGRPTLLEHQLLDELRFMIHPVFVGRGTLLFREVQKTALRLVRTKTLETGVVVLSYQPAAS